MGTRSYRPAPALEEETQPREKAICLLLNKLTKQYLSLVFLMEEA